MQKEQSTPQGRATMNRRTLQPRLIASLAVLCSLVAASSAHANWWSRKTSNFQDRPQLQSIISQHASQNVDIDEMAMTPSGEWVVVAGQNVVASNDFPSFPLSKIQQYVNTGATIDVVSFAPNGSYVIVAGGYRWFSGGLPRAKEFRDKINARIRAGRQITDVAFTGNGYSIISGGWAFSKNVPSAYFKAVYDRRASKREISGIEIGFDGGWAVYGKNFFQSSGVHSTLAKAAKSWQEDEREISCLMLGLGSNYVLFGNGSVQPNLLSKIDRIEYGLQAGGTNIFQAMEDANVPGLSIAVIDNNKVVYARGYGQLESGAQEPVLATSPFDAASLSKFVGATTILRVIDDPAHNMTLATSLQNVIDQGNNLSQLNIWRSYIEAFPAAFGIPNTTVPANQITITRLLSHTASMEPSGSTTFTSWPDFEPSTAALLLGYDCDDGSCSFGNTVYYNPVLGQPGSQYRYSGGGFLVAEAMTEQIVGDDFEQIAQDFVLDALGMDDSTFVQPLQGSYEARAAEQHDDGALKNRAHYPWNAAGGLYVSASDYAEVMIPMMNTGKTSKGEDFLHPFLVATALADKTPENNVNYGFGLSLSQNLVTEGSSTATFSHSGCHSRRARTFMVGAPSRDEGIVIMANSEGGTCADTDTKVATMISQIRVAFGCAYGWQTSGCM
jgi:CubicO group peptidase (beta-lactamase class C family)